MPFGWNNKWSTEKTGLGVGEKLHELHSKKDKTDPKVDLALSLIKESFAINESMRWVDLYENKARGYLEDLPMVPTCKALKELAEFVRTRKF